MTQPAKQEQPIICTFYMLQVALQSLHMNDRRYISTLHDVWLKGAPTPDSRIMTKTHDPRVPQVGNLEKRIVFPTLLEAWVLDVSKARGIKATAKDARAAILKIKQAWGYA